LAAARLIIDGRERSAEPAAPADPAEPQDNELWRDWNRAAWDELAAHGHPLARPAEDRLFENPLRCVDGPGWLGPSIRGQRVLCLAAGGGRHGPLYAAAGARVTVVDISAAMLQLDRQVAAGRRLDLETVQTSMDRLTMFADARFDLVIHPVSTCYVPQIEGVYREVARVLRQGGLYISQHKQPTSLQAAMRPDAGGYLIEEKYYRRGPLPVFDGKSPVRESGTREFVHRWEELIGQMCRAGFVIEDLLEPMHARRNAAVGTLGHRSQYVAPYVRIKARRMDRRG
jgi:ubiquinone/menaquinone biosynthesis C-methylase UbiE